MKKVILVFISVLSISILFNHYSLAQTARVPSASKSPCAELAAINHNISAAEVKELINRFESIKSDILSGAYRDSKDLFPSSGAFNRDAIYNLLKKDSVVGLRISFGLNSARKVTFVLTPVISPCVIGTGWPDGVDKAQTTTKGTTPEY